MKPDHFRNTQSKESNCLYCEESACVDDKCITLRCRKHDFNINGNAEDPENFVCNDFDDLTKKHVGEGVNDNIVYFNLIPVTPEEMVEMHPDEDLANLRRLAKTTGKCEVCGKNDIWRYGGTGMCFPCTTGETDGSNDYELI